RHPQVDDGNHQRGEGGAEVEHRAPVEVLEQPADDEAAYYATDRVTGGHGRDHRGTVTVIREFGRLCVDRREHATDADAGQYPPETEHVQAAGEGDRVHADHHHEEAAEDGRLASLAVCHA